MTTILPPNNTPKFQIIGPTKEQNRYYYRIRVDDGDQSAYLTYELPRISENRTILLMTASKALIPPGELPEYERLVERIKESARRFSGAKNIVNRLAEKEFANLPNVRIAVHKYGPVPVLLLPETYTIHHVGNEIEVQIGLYPNIKGSTSTKNTNYRLPFLSTKGEFVRSLNIGLGVMFRRYLEDVAEGMYDIKHHLSLAGIFDRAKEMETTLSQSIKTKLDVATPTLETFQHPQTDDERAVRELFESQSDWIFTARYARQFALYFLNELYRVIGLESRGEYYLNGFKDIQVQFDQLLGAGFSRNAREQLPLVAMLVRCLRAYEDDDYEALREIDVSNEPTWLRRFVQFSRFIATLHQQRLVPTAGRIFISFHHDVPVAEALMHQIADYIKTNFRNRVEVLSVKEKAAGVKFKSPIRARIWLSDTVSEIIPQNPEEISRGKVKDYLWIAREAEYSLLLGKRVIYLVESGADEAKVLADLKKIERQDGLIPSTARVPEWLQEKLLESFTEHTRAKFSLKTTESTQEYLDASVREVIHDEAERAIEKRHRDILVGFHKQFPLAARRTMKHIQETVPYPDKLRKGPLSRKMASRYRDYADEASAKKAIAKVWTLAKERALVIDGKPMHLIKMLDGQRYSGNLREILAGLRPDLSRDEIKVWEAKVLRAVTHEEESW
jgi:hypothetical protein